MGESGDPPHPEGALRAPPPIKKWEGLSRLRPGCWVCEFLYFLPDDHPEEADCPEEVGWNPIHPIAYPSGVTLAPTPPLPRPTSKVIGKAGVEPDHVPLRRPWGAALGPLRG